MCWAQGYGLWERGPLGQVRTARSERWVDKDGTCMGTAAVGARVQAVRPRATPQAEVVAACAIRRNDQGMPGGVW